MYSKRRLVLCLSCRQQAGHVVNQGNRTSSPRLAQNSVHIEKHIEIIQKTSENIAVLDVLCSFATCSNELGYVKPLVDDSLTLEIRKGRHPVIERTTEQGLFVSNDTYMDDRNSSMLIITGPNMAGKSTYMRQTALIVLMAQAGCFVPAEHAHIGVCDRIFTRIGASDNLAQGQSTFYVEMSEFAYILRNFAERSLIILDEIGRGTSTYDGLSIAWATVEYLCGDSGRARTLFATHYHELTALEDKTDGVENLNVEVSEENGNIVFLHKIVKGKASRSKSNDVIIPTNSSSSSTTGTLLISFSIIFLATSLTSSRDNEHNRRYKGKELHFDR